MNKIATMLPTLAVLTLPVCGQNRTGDVLYTPSSGLEEGIVFFDDFDKLDSLSWNVETHRAGWVNRELQAYSPNCVKADTYNGHTVLRITATRQADSITSGRINSRALRSFRYGRIEASIALPHTANGLWPAFWLMGDTTAQWPACGEIDIMEMGDAYGIAHGTQRSRVNTAIHYGNCFNTHQQQYLATDAPVDLQDGAFHTYSLTWSPQSLEMAVDGHTLATYDITDNPYFHRPFYIVLNMAVGGTFTGLYSASGISALPDGAQAHMLVDWVRVWQSP